MSKTESVSKSEMIRQHLKSMKPSERSPKAVSEALKKKGCDVTPGFVSVVKMKMSGKKKTKTKAIKAKARKKATNGAWKGWNDFLGAEGKSLVLAKDFLTAAGDVHQARKVLDIVNKLISAS